MRLKKIIAYMAVAAGLCALVLSTSKNLSIGVQALRARPANAGAWWAQQGSNYGDLTAMAYLDRVQRFCEPKHLEYPAPVSDNKNINLYLYGDSYTKDIPKSAFANVDELVFHYRYDSKDYTLDPRKRNILIIEISERFIRERFSSAAILTNLRINKVDSTTTPATGKSNHEKSISFSLNDVFNHNINHNLEYHLFNYNLLVAPRQLKALLNYKLFNRASGDVIISEDGTHLFYKLTVNSSICSSYGYLGTSEVNTIVASLDTVYDHYKQAGFSEVYFAPIPNPASILEPTRYNNLIPLIQNDTHLKTPVIDIYSIFKHSQNPETLYRAGDTHWNNKGLQIWLRLVNDVLKKEGQKGIK